MSRKHFRETVWLCVLCGYAMDTATPHEGGSRAPRDGDISLCMNCGQVYTREGTRWRSMTIEQQATLEAETRATIEAEQRRRLRARLPDLARKQQSGSH